MRRTFLLAGAVALALVGGAVLPATAAPAGQCTTNQYGTECELTLPGGVFWVHGGARYKPPHAGTVEGQVLTGDVWLDRTTSPSSGRWQGPLYAHAGVTAWVPAGKYYWRACTRQGKYYCTVWFK